MDNLLILEVRYPILGAMFKEKPYPVRWSFVAFDRDRDLRAARRAQCNCLASGLDS